MSNPRRTICYDCGGALDSLPADARTPRWGRHEHYVFSLGGALSDTIERDIAAHNAALDAADARDAAALESAGPGVPLAAWIILLVPWTLLVGIGAAAVGA